MARCVSEVIWGQLCWRRADLGPSVWSPCEYAAVFKCLWTNLAFMEEPDPDCWLVVGPTSGIDSQRPVFDDWKHQRSCCVVMGIICAEQLYRENSLLAKR